MRCLLILAILMMSWLSGRSQGELVLSGLGDIMQSDRYNPALFHQRGLHIALPSFYYDGYHTGAHFREVLPRLQDGSYQLRLSALEPRLAPENYMFVDAGIQTIKLRYGQDDWTVGVEHSMRYQGNMSYPADLVLLYLYGNEPYIGQTLSLGPNVRYMAYNDFAFSYSKKWNKVTIGVRPRLLVGQQLINTNHTEVKFLTQGDIYQSTLTTDYSIRTNMLSLEDPNNFRFRSLSKWSLWGNNVGFALDLGVHLNPNPRLNISFSLSDWGRIRWSDQIERYVSQKSIIYEGSVVSNIFELERLSIDSALDSILKIFQLDASSGTATTTFLPTYNATIRYRTSEKTAFFSSVLWNGSKFNPVSVALVGTHQLNRWLLGMSLSNKYKELNTGIQLLYKGERWLGFLYTEQLLAGWHPANRQFSLRLGFNIHIDGTSSFD